MCASLRPILRAQTFPTPVTIGLTYTVSTNELLHGYTVDSNTVTPSITFGSGGSLITLTGSMTDLRFGTLTISTINAALIVSLGGGGGGSGLTALTLSGGIAGSLGTGTLAGVLQLSGANFLQAANNLSDVASATTARTNLGLAIGTNVEASSSILDAVAAATYTGSAAITKIGTLTTGAVPMTLLTGVGTVPQGSTGTSSLPTGQLLAGNGTGAITGVTMGGGVSLAGGVLNVVVPKIYDAILSYNASGCGMTTTTGSLSLSLSALSVSSSWTFLVGEGITVPGAGAGGFDLVSTITGIVPGATVTVSGCTTASNSTTLTVSSATSLTTGMSITGNGLWPGSVVGAISGTAVTITNSYDPFLATPSATITGTLTATFVGAGTLSISGTAATSVSAALVRHNDLGALNAAVAAATINRAPASGGVALGGTIFLSCAEALDGSGIYEVEGAWNATTDSLITFPASVATILPATDLGFPVQVSILGEKRGTLDGNYHFSVGGTTIDASHQMSYTTSSPTGTNIWPAVISPGRYTVSGATFSATDIFVDNVLIQLPTNPNFGGVWLGGSLRGSTGDKVPVIALTSSTTSDVWAQPTSTYSFGIGFPQNANNVQNVCGQDEAVGVYYGFVGGEHVRLDRPVAFYCAWALYLPPTCGVHTVIGAIDSENTAGAINDAGGTPLDLDLNIELNNASEAFWYTQQPGQGFSNSISSSWGIVRYSINTGGTIEGNNGWGTPLDVNGGQTMTFTNMNDSVGKPTTAMLQYNMGSVTDAAGNQNLTNVGSVTFTTASGLSGATHAAIFNGTSQVLDSAAALGIVPWGVFGGKQYTFSGWFNTSTTSIQNVVGQFDNSNTHGGWQLYLASSQLSFVVGPTFTPSSLGPSVTVTTTTLSINAWHFYVATLDGRANTISLAVDGGQAQTLPFSGAVVGPTVPFTFGNNWNFPSTIQTFWFKGMMSNFRMYDYILSAQQQSEIWNNGKGTEAAILPDQAYPPQAGTATLAAGVATVTASSAVPTSIVIPGSGPLNSTTTLGTLIITPTTGSFTITSSTATGSVQTGDLRTVPWSLKN